MGPNLDEPQPATIDGVMLSRYRFYAASNGPGRGCGPVNVKAATSKASTSARPSAVAFFTPLDQLASSIVSSWVYHTRRA
jgi:hypothetical protein